VVFSAHVGGGPQIVVVGDEADRASLVVALREVGLPAEAASRVLLDAADAGPALIIVAGRDPGAVAALCAEARAAPPLAAVPILAAFFPGPGPASNGSNPGSAARAALAAGATDAITITAAAGPSDPEIAGRVRLLAAAGATAALAGRLERAHADLDRVQDLLARGGDDPDALREALLVAVDAMQFDRASLVAHLEGSDHAYVLAATDDPTLSQFVLAIADYPELDRAIKHGEPVLIADVQSDPITAHVAGTLAETEVRAVAVYPVLWKGRALGAVLFRRAIPGTDHIDPVRARFGRLFAACAAPHLRHGRVLESLREQTRSISRTRFEAERRLRTMDSLKEHFEAAADGVFILDDAGRILFLNHTAEVITGFARDGLQGAPLADLLPPQQRPVAAEIIGSVLAGQNLEPFDLDLATTSGSPICVSVSTSTVLSSSGAVILSFRDVTQQRALEIELRKTKEFLERLIDSTVDAIIAADMRGNVILFNQGAERLYGYSADQVIGKIPVWELYEDGVPRQVMRMLRSTSYGGVGRLEQTRREIKARSGELVPVNMTASIIYEEGREVATVGIFSDLRERIRIEQRLLQAQERLELSEKHALVAELAGAAAHELNQPLTSIIGYTQLIQRQGQKDAPHMRSLGIILRESERMAEIVKKIGRITKYETVEYLGGANIIDLNKSSPSASNSDLVLPDPPDDTDVTPHRMIPRSATGPMLPGRPIPRPGSTPPPPPPAALRRPEERRGSVSSADPTSTGSTGGIAVGRPATDASRERRVRDPDGSTDSGRRRQNEDESSIETLAQVELGDLLGGRDDKPGVEGAAPDGEPDSTVVVEAGPGGPGHVDEDTETESVDDVDRTRVF
jgi:PAS domain S-box-containing protein